jgi:hypothetical protein
LKSPHNSNRRSLLRVVKPTPDRLGAASSNEADGGQSVVVPPRSILKVRVELGGVDEPVWRELLLPARLTLEDVHQALQLAFEWEDSELHEFQYGHQRFLDARDDLLMENANLSSDGEIRLHRLIETLPTDLHYVYGQGEIWIHTVRFLEIQEACPLMLYPLCIGGQNASPPEGVGAAVGYNDFIKCLQKPSSTEGKEALHWIGGYWDPTAFSANAINLQLHSDRKLVMVSNSQAKLMDHWGPEI